MSLLRVILCREPTLDLLLSDPLIIWLGEASPNKISDNWLRWFIGFVEGDGCLQMTKNGPRFVLIQKELAILVLVKFVHWAKVNLCIII